MGGTFKFWTNGLKLRKYRFFVEIWFCTKFQIIWTKVVIIIIQFLTYKLKMYVDDSDALSMSYSIRQVFEFFEKAYAPNHYHLVEISR